MCLLSVAAFLPVRADVTNMVNASFIPFFKKVHNVHEGHKGKEFSLYIKNPLWSIVSFTYSIVTDIFLIFTQ